MNLDRIQINYDSFAFLIIMQWSDYKIMSKWVIDDPKLTTWRTIVHPIDVLSFQNSCKYNAFEIFHTVGAVHLAIHNLCTAYEKDLPMSLDIPSKLFNTCGSCSIGGPKPTGVHER